MGRDSLDAVNSLVHLRSQVGHKLLGTPTTKQMPTSRLLNTRTPSKLLFPLMMFSEFRLCEVLVPMCSTVQFEQQPDNYPWLLGNLELLLKRNLQRVLSSFQEGDVPKDRKACNMSTHTRTEEKIMLRGC